MGIEPTSSAWKAEVLPLNYTRLSFVSRAFLWRAKILTVSIHQTVRISKSKFSPVELPTSLAVVLCLAAFLSHAVETENGVRRKPCYTLFHLPLT